MIARSKSSNQRPDTLMQDRNRQLDENLLQRAAGPYIWVKSTVLTVNRSHPVYPDQRTFREKSACRKGANCGHRADFMTRHMGRLG